MIDYIEINKNVYVIPDDIEELKNENLNILNLKDGKIFMIVLEGTDAVGKTSVINSLPDYKLLDRDKNIYRLFDFNVSLVDRVNKLKKYLKSNRVYVIFLINNDKDELERRIQLREVVDEYDRYAYLYNLLYVETYLYMKQKKLLGNRLFMVDCTGLSLEEETCKVKEIIDNILQLMKGRK